MSSDERQTPGLTTGRPAQAIVTSPREAPTTKGVKPWVLVATLTTVALVVLLANLGDQLFWQDEAQTALIAGTTLTHGIPLGHDGRNSFSQDRGQDYGRNKVWLWHPWLSFYVLAGFFALLGKSTFVARLPFALFGVASVVVIYCFAASLWQSKRAGIYAALTLLLNVPFLILTRQCRYYGPGMFFAVLALFEYWRLIERRRYSAVWFGIAAIGLFHTQYVHYAALLIAVNAHAFMFCRARRRAVLIASGITVLVDVPWIIWFSAMGQVVGGYANVGSRASIFLQKYLQMIEDHMFPPLLLLLPLAIWITRSLRPKAEGSEPDAAEKKLLLLLFFIAATLAAACLTSTYPFFRSVAPIIPISSLIIALILDRTTAIHRVAGPIVSALVLIALGRTWGVSDYFYEVTHHYDGPVEGIVKYLQQHSHKDDVVAITYEDLPVKFYTGLRVVGGLAGDDLSPARTAEWVIIRKHVISDKDLEVRQFLVSQVPLGSYEVIRIDYPDVPFQNREEPDKHRFRTPKGDPIIIFHKRDTPVR